MITAAELAQIFASPFPYVEERNGRAVLFRSADASPMIVGCIDDPFLLGRHASQPRIQRDLWTAIMRLRWPRGIDHSDILQLELFRDQAARSSA